MYTLDQYNKAQRTLRRYTTGTHRRDRQSYRDRDHLFPQSHSKYFIPVRVLDTRCVVQDEVACDLDENLQSLTVVDNGEGEGRGGGEVALSA